MSHTRCNILLIHSDQHRFDCVGANQPHAAPGPGRLVRTPHLDRLAAEGVNFVRAFTPNPVCSPARACLQTGAWSTTHGCITIPGTEAFRPADPALPVLTRLLADAGYRVGHVGKYHQEVRGRPTDHGAEVYTSSNGYARWREGCGLPPRPKLDWFGGIDPHVDADATSLAWQCDRALDVLESFAAGDAPFFLRWDPPEPHLPNIVPAAMADEYPQQAVHPWPSFPDPLEGKPAAQRRTRERWGTEDWTWDDWRPVVSRYQAEVNLLDRQVGRLVTALDRLDLAQNTLVVYTTDHGDMCGGHGMMDKHYVMYDDIMRVPLILRWPEVLSAGVTSKDWVSHEIDLARTFLRVAGIEPPPSFVGRDLVADLLGESTPPARTDIFAQYQGTTQGLYTQRMLRTECFKYSYNPVSVDELYDLREDPGELHNLVLEQAYVGDLRHLRERMADWMTQINDPVQPPLWRWVPARC